MTRKQYQEMINKLANEVGISRITAKKWLAPKIRNDRKRKPEKPY
jgi:response regulator of citrate/malate metabolism